VDLGEEESAFTGVASQCLSVLVLGINTRLDACLQVGTQRQIQLRQLKTHAAAQFLSVSVTCLQCLSVLVLGINTPGRVPAGGGRSDMGIRASWTILLQRTSYVF
jgi:hypothetical protein